MPVELTAEDRAALDGSHGETAALAMRIVVAMAEVMDAPRLIDVTAAHIDGCLYHGRAGLDFARRLVDGGGRVAIPTTLNVSSLDLLHPELVHLDRAAAAEARELMDAYVSMGCRATWTCAPYQLPGRPAFGEQIAWAESNAIVFANSVLGARTNRYGDFIDICCAITGRAPFAGLHTDEGRRATALFALDGVPSVLASSEAGAATVGHVVGRRAGTDVPAIVGLAAATPEDHLRALGAGAASSGAVAMFHAVGVTPEAPTLEVATGGVELARSQAITTADLRAARDELSTVGPGSSIGAVSVGTPHLSLDGLGRLAALVADSRPTVPFYANVGRVVRAAAGQLGVTDDLERAGVTLVSDTCTYITPVIRETATPVMTDSAKWAWYAPGNLGFDTAFGSMEECVRSAAAGVIVRDEELWSGD
ncbi:MAG: aconitase X [Actinomycetota bacterium]